MLNWKLKLLFSYRAKVSFSHSADIKTLCWILFFVVAFIYFFRSSLNLAGERHTYNKWIDKLVFIHISPHTFLCSIFQVVHAINYSNRQNQKKKSFTFLFWRGHLLCLNSHENWKRKTFFHWTIKLLAIIKKQ